MKTKYLSIVSTVAAFPVYLYAHTVNAAIPTTPAPTTGGGAGDIFGFAKGWLDDLVLLIGGLVVIWAIFATAKNVIATYNSAAERDGSMATVVMHAAGGAVIIGFAIFLTALAITILK